MYYKPDRKKQNITRTRKMTHLATTMSSLIKEDEKHVFNCFCVLFASSIIKRHILFHFFVKTFVFLMNKSPDLKKTIIALHNSGSSSHKIAHQLSLSQSTVSRLIKRYKQTGDDVPSRKKGSGGRFSLSTREIRIINRESLIHPHLTAANIQVSVGGKCQNLSVRTIRRYLRRSNILAYRPSKSPALTARQRKRQYAHKRHDWSKTAFSDETYICLQPNCPGQYVRRQKGQRINLNHCKHNRAFCKKIMVWAVIDESGPGSIVCFRGTMDSVKYKNLMESVIIPFSDMIGYFQHDNAPPHKAQSVVNALNDNGVSVLDWPPYSCLLYTSDAADE